MLYDTVRPCYKSKIHSKKFELIAKQLKARIFFPHGCLLCANFFLPNLRAGNGMTYYTSVPTSFNDASADRMRIWVTYSRNPLYRTLTADLNLNIK